MTALAVVRPDLSAAVEIPLAQGSPEWLEARRSLVTASDIPVLLGLSPYRCEADLADEKRYGKFQESNVHMRMGLAMEPLIAAEYSAITGRELSRFAGLLRHPSIEWAACSPDFVGDDRLVEAKWTSSRTRFADGLPRDVEAQVAWQLGVSGWAIADVAVLTPDGAMPPFEVRADPELFANLVDIATDFRARLEAGGPFARDLARLKGDYPSDDGSEIEADGELAEAAHALAAYRAQRKALETAENELEAAIKTRMGPATRLVGDDFTATWKRTKDTETTDWRSLAESLLRQQPETEREALVGIHTSVRSGFRPFRLVMKGDSQ